MAEQPGLDLSPFSFAGGPVGCLLIHGFTGAPPDMRPMGEYLAGRGLTVLGVRLPGHGTTPADLQHTTWRDWTGEAERGLAELQGRCEQVFAAGVSMGGLLTLYLGERHTLAGLIPMAAAIDFTNPAFRLAPIAKYLLRETQKRPPAKGDWADPQAIYRHWSYNVYPLASVDELLKLRRRVRAGLPQVTAPMLIMQGLRDSSVPPASAQWLYDHVGSTDKELALFRNSGHCLAIDAECAAVWQRAFEFIHSHCTGGHCL